MDWPGGSGAMQEVTCGLVRCKRYAFSEGDSGSVRAKHRQPSGMELRQNTDHRPNGMPQRRVRTQVRQVNGIIAGCGMSVHGVYKRL